MVGEGKTPGGNDRLDGILAILRESRDKTVRYMTGTAIFYIVLITAFSVLTAIAKESEGMRTNLFILILVSLGFLGMWISALRGLKGTGAGIVGFFNIFHLPLRDRIGQLEDAGAWRDPAERLNRAEDYLEHQAEAEREMRAWPNRLLSLSVITIIDLLIWLVAGNWVMALINQCIAMVVSQVHITMAPTASLKAVKSGKEG